MRWWVSVALLAACRGGSPAPASLAHASRPAPRGEASCKVSTAVCDPQVSDEAALAIVSRRCAGCHAEGGAAAHPLLDAAALLRERGNLALRLAGCEMPPDATPLPHDERARLIGWGACAASE